MTGDIVFIYLVWDCQGESNLLIDRGFPVEKEVMGSIVRPCTWSVGRHCITLGDLTGVH